MNKEKLLIETKPHGGGDIHYLLYQSGKVKKWIEEGKKYFISLQDTNKLNYMFKEIQKLQ